MLCYLALLVAVGGVSSLDNGLGRTPPMGWLSWERYRCELDCVNRPTECISENLYLRVADELLAGGYLDAGYNRVNIDDCWSEKKRDNATGRLVADKKRFPHGIKWLADQLHGKGLLVGIYGDVGTLTCGGYPGTYGNEEIDSKTFAEWGIDMLKMDGCNLDTKFFPTVYPKLSKALLNSGHPILYSCSWPAYVDHKATPFKAIAQHCNIWRNYDDVQDSWASVANIINFWSMDESHFLEISAPGQFNDPDMLLLGDYGLSITQQQSQFGMWALFAAPLFLSAELTTVSPAVKAIILNRDVIAVNQDPLGLSAFPVIVQRNYQVWRRELKDGVAVGILSITSYGEPLVVSVPIATLTLPPCKGEYEATDLYDGKMSQKLGKKAHLEVVIDPSGIRLFRMTCVKNIAEEENVLSRMWAWITDEV